MWLNNKEESVFGPFSDFIHKNENKKYEFEYEDGTILIVELFVDEYESENGLELKDSGYEEYWEMAFKIIEVKKDDKNTYEVGKYILVNYHCIPKTYKVVK